MTNPISQSVLDMSIITGQKILKCSQSESLSNIAVPSVSVVTITDLTV